MNPIQLVLQNFEGILDGTGKNEISLDLSALPEGLIAIVGPNGRGKTTVMDNLHPYRIMPSRATSYSEKGFSFFDHISGSKAVKELIWEHKGVTYKSELVFTVKSKSTSAFLYVKEGENWHPYHNLDCSIVSDGKVTSYDAAVQDILGSAEIYFTSQYLAQKRKDLSSYGSTEMKSLLSDLLGIEKYRSLSRKAGETADTFKTVLATKQQEDSRLIGSQSELDQIELDQEKRCLAMNEHRLKISAMTQAIRAATQRTAIATENFEKAKQRLAPEKLAAEIREAELRHASMQQQANRQRIEKSQVIEHLKINHKKQSELIARESVIRESAVLATKLIAEIEDIDKTIADTRDGITELSKLKATVEGKQSTLNLMAEKGKVITVQMEDLNKVHSVIQIVPCHATQMVNSCPLLCHAKEAKSKEASFNKQLAEMRTQYVSLRNDIETLAKKLIPTQNLEKLLQASVEKKDQLAKQYEQVKVLAAELPVLEKAIAEVDHCQRLLIQEEESFERLKLKLDTDLRALESSIAEKKQAQLGSTELTELEKILISEQGIEREYTSQKEILEKELTDIAAIFESQNVRVVEMKKSITRRKALEVEIHSLNKEIEDYTKLSIALGMKGIIALCIDDAGPALSRLTNVLLDCFGSQYQIEIRTQRTKADGTKAEDFDIVVIDHKSPGKEKRLEFLSVGQKVWINECLSRAISLYLGENNGAAGSTLFSDETDGSLDVNKRLEFMRMKRKVLELSGCKREFFVSHAPACVDHADAVIDMTSF
ncbi:hypothetical protein [Flavobacterium sp.]|uniref:hypothetical protein n=1 Tax=Flavobacterium sp. TaxID=239 RepID=UPI0026340C3A|nr:hypothetical protein [Flavobacterium sp.]